MARVSTYLNFPNQTEQAFNHYKKVFGTEFEGGIKRFGDAPPQPGQPPMDEATRKLVMHVALPILAGHMLMGTDAPETMGFKPIAGNNFSINLEPDTRAEADRLFQGLSEGGKVEMPMTEMFWGAYWGSFKDKFGIGWMINCQSKT